MQLLYDCVLIVVCAYAFRFGGRDEKIAALLVLICSVATAIIVAVPGFSWSSDKWQVALVDLGLLVGLGWQASLSDRFWPLWATAFQLIDVTMHALMISAPHRVLHAYVVLQAFWAYPILLTIAVGSRRFSARQRLG